MSSGDAGAETHLGTTRVARLVPRQSVRAALLEARDERPEAPPSFLEHSMLQQSGRHLFLISQSRSLITLSNRLGDRYGLAGSRGHSAAAMQDPLADWLRAATGEAGCRGPVGPFLA